MHSQTSSTGEREDEPPFAPIRSTPSRPSSPFFSSSSSSSFEDLYTDFLQIPPTEKSSDGNREERALERGLDPYISAPPGLPKLREIDMEYKVSESAFGNSETDSEWNHFAGQFYDWLQAVGRLNSYWHSAVLRNPSGWEEAANLLASPVSTFEFETSRPHRPVAHCLQLDACNTRNGKHLCYAYWLKILRSSTELYAVLVKYFESATRLPNFSKIVLLEGIQEQTKDRENGGGNVESAFVPQHKTSMRSGLWVEICRTRLVCRMPQLFPLSEHSYDMQRIVEKDLLERVSKLGILNSCFFNRPVLVTPCDLHSTTKLSDLLAKKERIYLDRRNCCDAKLSAAAADLADRCDAEIEAGARVRLVATLERASVPPVTCYQEATGSLIHRYRTLWHTALVVDYENYLLDKQAAYFFSPKGAEVYDDPVLRCSLSLKTAAKLACAGPDVQKELIGNVAKHATELQRNVQHFANGHFAYHSACFGADVIRELRRACKYPHFPWIPHSRNEEEARFKNEYFVILRTFFKIWFRYKQMHAPEILQDDLNDRYLGAFLTRCEVDWGKYRGTHIDWSAISRNPGTGFPSAALQKVVSETKTSLLRTLRGYERDRLNTEKNTSVADMHNRHRSVYLHRGYADWTRMFITGSVFGSHFKEFTSSESAYVLDQDQDEGNGEWFERSDFPFIWCAGGRYKVYCNGKTWYRWKCPLDLVELVRTKSQRTGSIGKEIKLRLIDPENHDDVNDEWFAKFAEKCRQELAANPILDPHFYPGTDPRELKIFLRNHLSGCEEWKFQQPFFEGNEDANCEEQTPKGKGAEMADEKEEEEEEEEEEEGKGEDATFTIPDEALRNWLNFEIQCLQTARSKSRFETPQIDDGDTFYDTLALWFMMCLETVPPETEGSAKLRASVLEACAMVLDPTDEKVRNDRFFENFLTIAERTKEMTHLYEKLYLF